MDPQPKGQCGARRKQTGRGYGVGEPIAVGALRYVPNNTSDVDRKIGGRRRSKKKKSAGRRSKRKTAGRRGGGSIGTVGYGYSGSGSRGLADPVGYVANPPTPNGGYPMKYTQ